MIHYGVTKTAEIAVARGLAEVVAGTGITVNSVLPGPTKSRGIVDFVGALRGTAKRVSKSSRSNSSTKFGRFAIKRFAAPEEVASFVTYIASLSRRQRPAPRSASMA